MHKMQLQKSLTWKIRLDELSGQVIHHPIEILWGLMKEKLSKIKNKTKQELKIKSYELNKK